MFVSMGFKLTLGNNVYINLEPDTRADTERLFNALGAGGTVEMALQEMFWVPAAARSPIASV
jgi:PhnB protein